MSDVIQKAKSYAESLEDSHLDEESKCIVDLILSHESLRQKLEAAEGRVGELSGAITSFLVGDYKHPRSYRPNDCPHGESYYKDCNQCDSEFLEPFVNKALTDNEGKV